jgi:hypothetical protein
VWYLSKEYAKKGLLRPIVEFHARDIAPVPGINDAQIFDLSYSEYTPWKKQHSDPKKN